MKEIRKAFSFKNWCGNKNGKSNPRYQLANNKLHQLEIGNYCKYPCVNQFFQLHTGPYIKEQIMDTIKEYDMGLDQIYR